MSSTDWRDPAAIEYADRFTAQCVMKEPVGVETILLSGGMDSMTILAALVSAGRVPKHAYSFTVGGRDYEDLHRAQLVADRCGMPFTVVDIDPSRESAIAGVLAAGRAGATKKTHVQCWVPIDAMARQIVADHSQPVSVWMGTGGIVEDNRPTQVAANTGDWETVNRNRRESLVYGGSAGSATEMMHRALTFYKIFVREPFAEPPFNSWALSLDWHTINQRGMKDIGIRAFPEFFTSQALYAPCSSLQVGAGFRAWHDEIFLGGDVKQVIRAYRRLWAADNEG